MMQKKLKYIISRLKLRTYIALGILLLLVPILVFSIFKPSSIQAVWMDDSWSYRTTLSFTHNAGVSNTKVKFDIDTATLITAGKMQSDCGDSRFTDINGDQLPYYIDTAGGACNTSSTDYYVLIPTIINGSNVVYHYYGNPTVKDGTQLSQFAQSTTTPSGGAASTGSEEKGTSPVGYWNFDEGYGTTAHDSSGKNNSGAFTNSPVWKNEDFCLTSKCVYMDGTTKYVTVTDPSNKSLDFGASTDFTLSAWVRAISVANTPFIIDKRHTHGGNTAGYTMYLDTSARPILRLGDGSSVNEWTVSSGNFADQKWHLYTISASRTGTTRLFVDGNQVATADITAVGSITTSNSLDFGTKAAVSTNALNGYLDEVKIYNYARSAAQVKADFDARNGNEGVSANIGGNANQKFLSDGLARYWKLDETSGDAADSSGNAVTLVNTNTVTYGAGKYVNAAVFDGATNYLLKSSSGLAPTNITIAGWINGSSSLSGAKGALYETHATYGLRIVSSKLAMAITTVNNSFTQVGSSSTTLSTGTWYHAVVTYDGITVRYYLNGKPDGTDTSVSGAMSGGGSSNTYIGRDTNSSFFPGSIDEVRVYNRALSAKEVRGLYTAAPGPVGYWPLDEKTGTTTNDYSGNDYVGTLAGNATWTKGKVGSALSYTSPTSSAGKVTVAPGTNINDLGVMTAEAWIYPLSPGGSNAGRILAKGNESNNGWFWRMHGSNGMRFQAYFGTANLFVESANNTVTLNAWNHIVVTWDGTTSVTGVVFYINGVVVGYGSTQAGSGTDTSDAAENLRIGSNTAQTLGFDGVIDDVKVFNYIRTGTQVVEDMNGGHPLGGSPVGSQVSFWRMDETNGTTAHDASPNSNSLTLSAASWNTSGKTNAAWSGVGTNWLSRADDDDFDLAAADDGSISLWYNSTSASNPAATEYLFAKGRGTPPGYALYINTSGNLCFSIDDDSTWSPDDSACTTTDVYDATWHHVVAEKTGTTEIRLYLDGKSIAADISLAATGSLANSGTLYVGDDDGDSTNAFNGSIDEVKFYRSALTLDQVNLDYNSGAALNFGSTASAESSQLTGGTGVAPIDYWPMDEKTGTTANDKGTGAKNGTLSGNTIWTQGKNGSALLFDGATGVDAVGGFTPPAIMTYEIWFNARSLGENSLGRIAVHSNFDIFLLTSLLQFQANWTTSGKWTVAIPSFGAWHHLVVVYDSGSVSNDPVIYIDGVSQTVSETQTPVGSITLSSATLRIGNTSADDRTFDGAIDDFKIYNYVRSADQVAYDYNRGGPVGLWRFDECQDTTANDTSGKGNNGTITIGATGTQASAGTCTTSSTAWGNGTAGKFNASLNFDGTDDYVACTDANCGGTTKLDFNNSSPFSIAAWIKTTTSGAVTIISKKSTAASGTAGYMMQTSASNFGVCRISDGTTQVSPTGTTALNDGNWHLVSCVYTGTTLQLYVDSVLIAQSSTASVTGTFDNTSDFRIGTTGAGASFFNGQIDDVRVYNYALSLAQIRKLLINGASVNFGPASGQP